ncbi:MAG: glycosyltransferase [Nanoarchaeota archaeon]|nr:glycosyltransferase [Nanoarchaeota archaeon]
MVKFSVLVPCYNEAERGREFLPELAEYLSRMRCFELILINDGSDDSTMELLDSVKAKHAFCHVLDLKRNQGKGGALREGVFKAEGDRIIFIDADGSIAPDQLPKMLELLEHHKFVTATRYMQKYRIEQPISRVFMGLMFNLYVEMLFRLGIKDVLCGFKGFHSDTARSLFKDLISKRWVFDVELFYRAKKMGINVKRFSISWVHRGGSKITLIDPFKMAWQLFLLRLRL